MASDDVNDLGRFLQRPGAAAAARSEGTAAADVTEMFAREAVLALHQYEQTFSARDQESGRGSAERFGYLWHQAGLDQADWSGGDPSDAERILAAAAELADDPARRFSVAEASRLAQRTGPVRDTADRIQTEVNTAYGDAFSAPDPSAWLEQSLGRLARARVVKDLVGLDTRAEPGPELVQAGAAVVREAQQYADQRRGVDAAAKQVTERESDRNRWVGHWCGYTAFTTSLGLAGVDTPDWMIAVKAAPAAYITVTIADKWGKLTKARDAHDDSRTQLAGQREKVAGAVDRVPRPSRPGGGLGR